LLCLPHGRATVHGLQALQRRGTSDVLSSVPPGTRVTAAGRGGQCGLSMTPPRGKTLHFWRACDTFRVGRFFDHSQKFLSSKFLTVPPTNRGVELFACSKNGLVELDICQVTRHLTSGGGQVETSCLMVISKQVHLFSGSCHG